VVWFEEGELVSPLLLPRAHPSSSSSSSSSSRRSSSFESTKSPSNLSFLEWESAQARRGKNSSRVVQIHGFFVQALFLLMITEHPVGSKQTAKTSLRESVSGWIAPSNGEAAVEKRLVL